MNGGGADILHRVGALFLDDRRFAGLARSDFLGAVGKGAFEGAAGYHVNRIAQAVGHGAGIAGLFDDIDDLELVIFGQDFLGRLGGEERGRTGESKGSGSAKQRAMRDVLVMDILLLLRAGFAAA